MTPKALLLLNIGQLLTLRGPATPRRGRELSELGLTRDAAVLCAGGKIVSIGDTKHALRDPWIKKQRTRIRHLDCRRQVVLPGFVDSHTHPAFAAPRLLDFEKRITGASYEEIAQAGGGIRASLAGVRKASRSQLVQHILRALERMAAHGTTSVEAKSGYGLSVESEIKSLEAIREAAERWPGTVVATLLGAHVVPDEFKSNPEKYVAEITKKMIPQAARSKLAEFVDVFCDSGAFSTAEAEHIFEAAQQHGLGTRAHVCQLAPSVLWPLLRFHPASFDHLDYVQDDDVAQLARGNTVATLLPTSNYFLGLPHYPPARRLIDAGVPLALATDYNPGTSPTSSMPFVLSLACTQMKMSPAEAIAAATINGAHALRLSDRKGSIEGGKDADLAIFDVQDYREIAYWVDENRCTMTIAGGNVCRPASSPA